MKVNWFKMVTTLRKICLFKVNTELYILYKAQKTQFDIEKKCSNCINTR